MAEGPHRPVAVNARVATAEDLPALAETFGLAFEDDPEKARQAPYTTPVRRLDEVKATRRPVVRQPLG